MHATNLSDAAGPNVLQRAHRVPQEPLRRHHSADMRNSADTRGRRDYRSRRSGRWSRHVVEPAESSELGRGLLTERSMRRRKLLLTVCCGAGEGASAATRLGAVRAGIVANGWIVSERGTLILRCSQLTDAANVPRIGVLHQPQTRPKTDLRGFTRIGECGGESFGSVCW